MDKDTPEPGAGKRRVQALTGQSVQRLEAKIKSQSQKAWPKKGGKLNGVAPGGWVNDGPFDVTGCLPEDCPVLPLGFDGEDFFFVDTNGQIFNSAGKDIGVGRMQILFAGHEDFLCWAWPSFGKGNDPQVNSWKGEEIRRDLYAACSKRGPWNMTQMVRGRGAWRGADGKLVLHCGEALWFDGEMQDTGEIGEHFYVRRPRTFLPWPEPVEAIEDNPAVTLFEALRTWNMVRGDVDAMLMLGWIGVALMGAALDWRPSVFLVGDAGTGKSELLHLVKAVLGRAMVSTTNATGAGLYHLVGQDSLPIAVDELEGEDGQAQAAKIVKMARDAASGSMRIRGGADHKGVEFEARSTFVFSAINPPGLPPASLTRLAMIQLRPLEPGGKKPELKEADSIGPKLLRRVADHWHDFQTLYDQYQAVLGKNGHDSRGQNTFGTFMAAAHLLLSDDGMGHLGLVYEALDHWGVMLRADQLAELSARQANWLQCVEDILIAQLDSFKGGEKQTVGQIILELTDEAGMLALDGANRRLGGVGLALVALGRPEDGYALAVPFSGRDINRLLANTSYAGPGSSGSWSSALRQGPDNVIRQKLVLKRDANPDNRLSIGGTQRRCTFIDLVALKALQDGREG